MSGIDIEAALDAARRAALAGGAAALRHFRRDFAIEEKPDRSPVTIADKESEAAILEILRSALPGAGILSEESGHTGPKGPTRWIVDPLDGTRGFTRGSAFWGPLVALEHEGEVVVGVLALPVRDEIYVAARGMGTFFGETKVRVSDVSNWPDATLMLGEMTRLFDPPLESGVRALVGSAFSTRCYGDVAGAAEVIAGRADAWIEPQVKIWDIAAIRVLVEEAGGVFTDLRGNRTIESDGFVATNGKLHAHVLKTLGGV